MLGVPAHVTHQEEAIRRPFALCPVDLHKLASTLATIGGMPVACREHNLMEFCQVQAGEIVGSSDHSWSTDAEGYRQRLMILHPHGTTNSNNSTDTPSPAKSTPSNIEEAYLREVLQLDGPDHLNTIETADNNGSIKNKQQTRDQGPGQGANMCSTSQDNRSDTEGVHGIFAHSSKIWVPGGAHVTTYVSMRMDMDSTSFPSAHASQTTVKAASPVEPLR